MQPAGMLEKVDRAASARERLGWVPSNNTAEDQAAAKKAAKNVAGEDQRPSPSWAARRGCGQLPRELRR